MIRSPLTGLDHKGPESAAGGGALLQRASVAVTSPVAQSARRALVVEHQFDKQISASGLRWSRVEVVPSALASFSPTSGARPFVLRPVTVEAIRQCAGNRPLCLLAEVIQIILREQVPSSVRP